MPLTGYNTTWGTTLANLLVFPQGNPSYATAKLSFAQSIANGLTFGFIGSEVTTTDSGTAPAGVAGGVGTGVGLSGFLTPVFSSTFTSLSILKFQTFTSENSTVMNAIATTFITALAQASINTTHSTVAVGSGIVTLIPPDPQTLTTILYTNAVPPVNSNPVYSKWYDYSEIIAKSIVAGCSAITGTVAITGTPVVPAVPAVGTGGGVIS